MSIFSKIKGASQAAKEHKKAKTPDPGLQKSAPARTRHVPTHAAIDAMLGAPSSWKEIDRSAIRAQHKRRSMMPQNDSGNSTPLRRNHSQGFYDTSTNYGSDYGIALSRLEPKRSHSSYFPYQPSRLGSHGMLPIKDLRKTHLMKLHLGVSPTISEVNSSSSSSAGGSPLRCPFLVTFA